MGAPITTEVLLVHERRHRSHLALCCIANTPLLGHRRSSNIFSRDLARARTGQPGGPRKLVLGVASAMGNNRGVFISPSFPSLGPHRNFTKNSDELKDILHAEPEPPLGDWTGCTGLG